MKPQHAHEPAELLESRRLFAAAIVNDVLVATGTGGNDVISVRRVLTDDVTVTINGVGKTFDMDDFRGVRLEGLGGNDTFAMIDALLTPVARSTTVLGGDGNDTLDYSTRTSAINFFIDPTAMSVAGTPRVGLPAHRDEFDKVETIIGGAGDDTFEYTQQNTFVGGPVSSYELRGRGGIDVFQDLVWPNADAFGSITMLGGAGNDRFIDQADPRFTREFFFGEADNDQADFYRRNDGTLDGGLGLDTIHFRGTPGDAQGVETGNVSDFDGFENATKEFGTLIGTDGPNLLEMFSAGTVFGLGGNDSINGSSGNDRLEGGDGDDNILGFAGDDTLDGGDGFDTLHGGEGDNTLINGEITDPAAPPAAIINGILVVKGTGFDDTISIRRHLTDDVIVTVNSTSSEFDMDDFTGVRLEGLVGDDVFRMIDALVSPVVRNVTVLGGDGNDAMDYSSRTADLRFHIDPTAPDARGVQFGLENDRFSDVETFIGGSGNDTFSYAQEGQAQPGVTNSFRLEGRGGNDIFSDFVWPRGDAYGDVSMFGGDGNDTFNDESDQRFLRDHFFGEAGNDTATRYQHGGTLDGGPGIDLLHFEDGGGDLRDFPGFENATAVPRIDAPDDTITLTGTDGPNTLSADGTRVHINGLGGDDAITGGSEDDTLSGGDGKDTLIGGAGDDELHGDAGSDWLTGQEGNDTLDGGAGAGTDTLDGDGGSNTNLNGEVLAGQQVAIGIVNRILNVIGTGAGESITLERTGIDDVIVRAGSRTAQFDMDDFNGVSVLGLGSNDVITITHALVAGSLVRKVTIDGGSGNDSLTGNAGDDVLRGGDGADTLIGLTGRDALFGGAGNDRLFGGLGLDFLDGGNNDDFIDASDSAGDDTVLGGSGSDTAKMDNGDSASSVEAFV